MFKNWNLSTRKKDVTKPIAKVNSYKPQLMNGYGELFDYKDEYQAQLAREKIHQKKLNLERELSKHKLQKKVENLNFLKLKNISKTSKKSQLKSLKFKYHADLKVLSEQHKYVNTHISFNEFIEKRIISLEKTISSDCNKTKKTIKSLKHTGDEVDVINQKIDSIYNDALKHENDLIFVINKLKEIKLLNIKWDLEESSTSYIKKILSNIKLEEGDNVELLRSNLNIIFKAYTNQYYFTLDKNSFDFERQKHNLKKEYETKKLECIEQNKKSLSDEKNKIKANYALKTRAEKTNFKFDETNIKYQNVLSEEKKLEKEIKQKIKQKNQFIRETKLQCKQLYKQKLYQYKKATKNELEFSFKLSKKDAIENSSYSASFANFLDYRLWTINKWKYKIEKSNIKAEYWKDLGSKINHLTYDGDFLFKKGEALEKNNLNKEKKTLELIDNVKNMNYANSFSKMSTSDKEKYSAQKQNLNDEFVANKKVLYQKFKDKEITREALKSEKMKLKVFYEEDVKHIKLNLDSCKDKYITKDALVTYHKSIKLVKKQLDQDNNNISKQVPIEYKKNSSIWMTLIALILPGVDQLILKNWKKAILMIIATAFMWGLLVPYAFGVANIQGQGVIGLIKLSWPIDYSPVYGQIFSDSRYALIEGVISVMFLVITFCYLITSAYMCFKITRSMEKGIRCNTWLETKKVLQTNGFPYAISIPGVILIAFISIMPIIVSLLLAFTNIGTGHNPAAGQETNWVGFEQFIRLFSDAEFFKPLGNVLWWNIVWAIGTTLLVLFIGTVMALAIENRNIKAKALWRTIYFLPWAIPAFISILFFKIIFDPSSTGLVNSVLISMDIVNKPINWTHDAVASRLILILIQGWLGHSYIVLLITGNMKSISSEMYEAATLDRATPFRQFMKLTLPIVLIQITPLLIGQFTFNFNNFSLIWLFNDGGAKIDPTYVYDIGNNDILLSWIFKVTFGSQAQNIESNQAIASALIIVMSIFIVGASGIGFANSKAFRKVESI